MSLSIDEVRKIALLARLRLEPDEESAMAEQLSQIVDYVDQLRDFEQAEAHAGANAGLEAADEAQPSMPVERFLDNAPSRLDAFLLVPQVKGDGDG